MKLHFYILEGINIGLKKLTYSECEAIEKPKTYKPVNRFPIGYAGSFVRKEDIGRPIDYNNNVCVLEEKDDKKAKEIFSRCFEMKLDCKKREVERFEKILKAINEFGDV